MKLKYSGEDGLLLFKGLLSLRPGESFVFTTIDGRTEIVCNWNRKEILKTLHKWIGLRLENACLLEGT